MKIQSRLNVIRFAVVLFGSMFSLGSVFIVFYTFLCAFLNGGHATVYVNWFGEAVPELVLLPFCLVCSVVSFYYVIVKKIKMVNVNYGDKSES